MRQPVQRAAVTVAAAAALVAGLSGCSKSVDKGDVADTIQSKLTASMTGHDIGDVSCEDNLKAEVDATSMCTAKIDGKKESFRAVVTSVDGDEVHYTIKLADQDSKASQ